AAIERPGISGDEIDDFHPVVPGQLFGHEAVPPNCSDYHGGVSGVAQTTACTGAKVLPCSPRQARGSGMKITDVTVTLFEWESKTATNVMHIDRKPGDKHDQGLVTISTDEGLQGHAFLGKAIDPASSDAAG